MSKYENKGYFIPYKALDNIPTFDKIYIGMTHEDMKDTLNNNFSRLESWLNDLIQKLPEEAKDE